MKSAWTIYKNKRILLADFSNFGFDADALRAEIKDVIALLEQEPPRSVLVISNVSGTTASPRVLSAFKSIFPYSNKYVIKRAAIGLKPAQLAFLDVLNRLTGGAKLVAFATREEALEWIVRD